MVSDDQQAVIGALGDAAFYGRSGDPVERIDTHSAVVFLVGDRAYKLKRAVRFDYLDFSTSERRRAACEAEVRLNRRTAPSLYLGVRAVTRRADGSLALDGGGEAVDALVEMRRFDNDELFDRLAERDRLPIDLVEHLARIVARFHDGAERRGDLGGQAAMRRVIDGNAAAFASEGAGVLDARVVEAIDAGSRRLLDRQGARLDERRRQGFVRQCHGDLHLGNIVRLDGEPTLFDGIEFNDDISCIDVWYDAAFLLMDLWHRGLRRDANAVFNEYLVATGDTAGLPLLPLFLSCRAAIRAKTSVSAAAVQPDAAHVEALAEAAREYAALAADLLAAGRARLVAIGGLSGTGKSAVAGRLAAEVDAAPGAVWLRSDRLRKQLLGAAPTDRLGDEAYGPEMNRRTYAELTRRAAAALEAGRAVIVDAVFAGPATRDGLEAVARTAGVPFDGIWLEAPSPLRQARLHGRIGDVSDATPEVGRGQDLYRVGEITWARVDASPALDAVTARVGRLLDVPAAAAGWRGRGSAISPRRTP